MTILTDALDELFDELPARHPEQTIYRGTCQACHLTYSTSVKRAAQLCDDCTSKPYEVSRFAQHLRKNANAKRNLYVQRFNNTLTTDPIEEQRKQERVLNQALQDCEAAFKWADSAEKEIAKLGSTQ
jgi:hypothetical protein